MNEQTSRHPGTRQSHPHREAQELGKRHGGGIVAAYELIAAGR
jgi:hypothetical protein